MTPASLKSRCTELLPQGLRFFIVASQPNLDRFDLRPFGVPVTPLPFLAPEAVLDVVADAIDHRGRGSWDRGRRLFGSWPSSQTSRPGRLPMDLMHGSLFVTNSVTRGVTCPSR